MKRQRTRWATLSILFGTAGAVAAFSRAGPAPLLAFPFAFFAVCTGLLGVWRVKTQPERRTGLRGAVTGCVLGVLAFFLGLGALPEVFRQAQRFDGGGGPGRRFHRGDAEAWREANRVPDERPFDPTQFKLPVVVLHSLGRSITGDRPTIVRGDFYDVIPGRSLDPGHPSQSGWVSVHGRGNSSRWLPKSSYTLHTLDAQTNQAKVALLGLPKEEDWVLYAPFEDKSLLRDVLAFELARRMGHYAPRTRFVELFIDEEPQPTALASKQYAGVYVLVEKIKRAKERVNIAKLEPEDVSEPAISGGYIVKRDHDDDRGARFHTSRGGPFFYVSPNERRITPEQRAWLSRYFRAFESALYGPDFADPQTGYAAYLDVDAFLDAHWLTELSKNVDGFRYSTFITKDRGGKLRPEPPWDFNRAFGNANYYGGWQTSGWYWPRLRPNEISWYQRLREDPEFRKRAAERWWKWRREVFEPTQIHALIDQWVTDLEGAQQRNFERWPVLGQQITCNYYVGQTYADEVRWLKEWITRRVAWIDSQVRQSEEGREEGHP